MPTRDLSRSSQPQGHFLRKRLCLDRKTRETSSYHDNLRNIITSCSLNIIASGNDAASTTSLYDYANNI